MKDAKEGEMDPLQNRIDELLKEQNEYKIILKEQSEQLAHYREKYLIAERKVKEQNVALEKLKKDSIFIGKDIGMEIKQIHSELQRRLAELQRYPNSLERDQSRLMVACKERDRLKLELEMAKKEILELKAKDRENDAEFYRSQWVDLTLELQHTKNVLEKIQRERISDESGNVIDQQSKSGKFTFTTKGSVDQQERIDLLEREVAMYRSMALASVNGKDSAVLDLQGQLNTLSFSLITAQEQIKTLNSRFTLLSMSRNNLS